MRNGKTFFHYKSMETLSCHSNESKNAIFVEAIVINIYAKFQLYPPYGFWGNDFLIFYRKLNLSVVMAISQIQRFGQKIMCL